MMAYNNIIYNNSQQQLSLLLQTDGPYAAAHPTHTSTYNKIPPYKRFAPACGNCTYHASHAIQGSLQIFLVAPQVNEAQHSSSRGAHLCWGQHTHSCIVQHLACTHHTKLSASPCSMSLMARGVYNKRCKADCNSAQQVLHCWHTALECAQLGTVRTSAQSIHHRFPFSSRRIGGNILLCPR